MELTQAEYLTRSYAKHQPLAGFAPLFFLAPIQNCYVMHITPVCDNRYGSSFSANLLYSYRG